MKLFRAPILAVALPILAVFAFVFVHGDQLGSRAIALYIKSFEVASTTLPIQALLPVHLKTPNPTKAVYISSWVAGSTKIRNGIIKMIDETELNAVVIDVKDSTGIVSFKMDDPIIQRINPFENRIPDIDNLISELHKKNIYVIARIAVFEDPHLAKIRPDLAVKRKSDGKTWRDRKGLSWTDIGSREVWDYNIAVARAAYKVGFDELNFDYIRFPSDGDMTDIVYPSLVATSSATDVNKKINKSEELRKFFYYLSESLKDTGAPVSADLFGMVTTNTDDLNIGQVLENAIPYFDYISPMVYPSHYPNGFHGYKNPATVPYELLTFVLGEGVNRLIAASSSPSQLRPWLQDFNLGATYTAEMVRKEIQAVYDVGLDSWLLWSPSNKYTTAALERED